MITRHARGQLGSQEQISRRSESTTVWIGMLSKMVYVCIMMNKLSRLRVYQ